MLRATLILISTHAVYMTQHSINQLALMHYDRYIFSVVKCAYDENDIEFEISGPDTLIRTRELIDACEVWQQITKRSDNAKREALEEGPNVW